jgi:hypothetical protein
MLSLEDHHLVLLMEECFEVGKELMDTGHRTAKQLRFGGNEIQPGQLLPNADRLRTELLDVMVCAQFLVAARMIGEITPLDIQVHMSGKQAKIDAMLELSRTQGRLEAMKQNPPAPRPMAGYDSDGQRNADGITGEICLHDEFIWEPHRNSRMRVMVVGIERGPRLSRIRLQQLIPVVVPREMLSTAGILFWEDESRVREACERVKSADERFNETYDANARRRGQYE